MRGQFSWSVQLGSIVAVFLSVHCLNDASDTISKEYCSSEAFHARCSDDHVLLITRAIYGRMRPGRCISNEYSQASNCDADITDYFDRKCSGRRQCQEFVGALDAIAQPCPKDFKSYLEVEYRCVKVSYSDECQQYNQTKLRGPRGYLVLGSTRSSTTASVTRCPWVIHVTPGQQISLTLLQLGPAKRVALKGQPSRSLKSYCRRRIVISDGRIRKTFDLCLKPRREVSLYRSESSSVTISGDFGEQNDEVAPVQLLLYEAHGCADIVPPAGAMVRRTGDNAVVVCNSTRDTWYMSCTDGHWLGSPANCSSDVRGVQPVTLLRSSRSAVKHGILLAVVVGALLGAVLGACLLTIICAIKKARHRRNDHTRSRDAGNKIVGDTHSGQRAKRPLVTSTGKQTSVAIPEYIHVFNCNQPSTRNDETYTLHRITHTHNDNCHGDYKSLRLDGNTPRRKSLPRGVSGSDVDKQEMPAYFDLENTLRTNT